MFAFVLMPFDKEFDNIYEDLIKPALESVGYDVRRADDLINQQNILKDIVCSIDQADLIVADLTAVNANVLYELGIAHTLQKPTVMIAQDIDDVPFDLRPYKIIPYSLNYKDTNNLQAKLREIAHKLKEGSLIFGNPVTDFAPSIQQGRKAIQEDIKHRKEKAASGEIPELDEEPGMWDFIVEAERSLDEISKYTEKMASMGNSFAEKMNIHALEINSIKGSSTPGSSTHMHKKLKTVASDIIQYAKDMEVELPGYHYAWERLVQNSTEFLSGVPIENEEDRKGLIKLKESMEIFKNAVTAAMTSNREIKEKASLLKKLTRDLNHAIKLYLQVQDRVIVELSTGESYVARILNLINDRLENRGNSV